MRRTRVVMRVLAVAFATSGVWGLTARAGEAEEQAEKAVGKEELAEALKGFRGFLVGELAGRHDDGIDMLVRAVTLVEGNQAANPGILIGLETRVLYALETGDDGEKRPLPDLVRAIQHIKELPAFAFGGHGGNAVIVMDMPGQGKAGHGKVVRMHAQRMVMNVNGVNIQMGGDADEEGDEPAREPKGPILTARVLAGQDGALVMDRVLPGSQPGDTWRAMAKLQFADGNKIALGGEVAIDADDLAARVVKERWKAIKAQTAAIHKQLGAVRKRLAAGDDLPEAEAQALRQQEAALLHQLAQTEKQIAMLKQQAEMRKRQAIMHKRHKGLKKIEPPPRNPNDTDF